MLLSNTKFLTGYIQSILKAGRFDELGQCSIDLYAGAIPTDAQAQNFDPAIHAANLVGRFTNLSFQVLGNVFILKDNPSLNPITATVAKTITWGRFSGANGVGIICEPTLQGGTGPIQLDKMTTTVGGTLKLIDSGVCIGFNN